MVDFKGQQLSERIFQVVTVAATVIGFFYGWYEQSFAKTVEVWAVGVALSVVLCVPDWWFYRKNPIEWREEDYGEDDDESGEEDEDEEGDGEEQSKASSSKS